MAHQLGLHGLIAPAATQLGQTLALFTDLPPAAQRPIRCMPDELWQGLPPDPRVERRSVLRVVSGSET
jgi:hypothetical protein